MLYGGLAVLRGRYLFDLAATCHLSPEQVDGLWLADFGLLIDGIDQQAAALAQMARPPGG